MTAIFRFSPNDRQLSIIRETLDGRLYIDILIITDLILKDIPDFRIRKVCLWKLKHFLFLFYNETNKSETSFLFILGRTVLHYIPHYISS